ncbi:GtrA family protein [Radiobacillus kanasensis]|uniref:GtrA family protein n=1 Tax=Radiobacillus kanasensis TaxID=2844358 RepID=UPI001E3A7420|nr:GtrA family protein [Radiobacillus kanasensis]UFT98881.1 GtrA family protein [Radiobacillus kanasensis]
MNYLFSSQIVRFIIVGFINTFNYYVLYLLLFNLVHFHYMISHILAFLISMVGSFFMNSLFTYKTKPTFKKFFQFPLTYVVNISVSSLAVFILVDLMKFDENISPLLASVIAIPFTFLLSKKILTK